MQSCPVIDTNISSNPAIVHDHEHNLPIRYSLVLVTGSTSRCQQGFRDKQIYNRPVPQVLATWASSDRYGAIIYRSTSTESETKKKSRSHHSRLLRSPCGNKPHLRIMNDDEHSHTKIHALAINRSWPWPWLHAKTNLKALAQ